VSGATGALGSPPFPIILAAPSGAGKTSIAHELRRRRPDVAFSISATSRPPRPGERDGVDYHFRDEPEFRRLVERGEMLEWARVHGNLYGTPLRNLDEARARGCHLLLDIDVQGSRQIRDKVPEAVSIFVLPPSGRELVRRLVARGSEDEVVRRRRLLAAREELAAATEFDYVLVNEELDTAVSAVERIVDAEVHRTRRLASLGAYLDSLTSDLDESLGGRPTAAPVPPVEEQRR
jgi:guanylate kinase